MALAVAVCAAWRGAEQKKAVQAHGIMGFIVEL